MTKKALQIEMILLAVDTDRQELATALEVDRTTIGKTLAGKRSSQTMKERIAEELCNRVRVLVVNDEPAPT